MIHHLNFHVATLKTKGSPHRGSHSHRITILSTKNESIDQYLSRAENLVKKDYFSTENDRFENPSKTLLKSVYFGGFRAHLMSDSDLLRLLVDCYLEPSAYYRKESAQSGVIAKNMKNSKFMPRAVQNIKNIKIGPITVKLQ